MPRDARALLEARIEALEGHRRSIESEAADLERELEHERERYRAAVAHWQEAGPDAIAAERDAVFAREARKTFWMAFAAGTALPLAGGLTLFFLTRG